MSRIFISGVAGFLGSHVAQELIAMGHEVHGMDDFSGGFAENIPEGCHFWGGSVCDDEYVNEVFDDFQFDYVFHLAAYAAEGLSHFIKRFNYENNVLGSVTLINAAVNHNVKGFVFTSSIAVYGGHPVPYHEDMVPDPEDSYGIAKYTVEQELAISHEMFGLPYIIFRPHNIYGPRQNIADKYRNVVGIFMNQALKGEPFTIFGTGDQVRAFTYVSDVAPVIAHSIENPAAYQDIFNLGSDTPHTVNHLARLVAKAMDVPLKINYLPERNEVITAYSDHTRARLALGAKPHIGLEMGIQDMTKWVKEVGPRQPIVFDKIEIQKNLPPSWRTK